MRPRAAGAFGSMLVVALIGSSCSAGVDTAAVDPSPTFRQLRDESLVASEPLSTVTDLESPAGEDQPWRIAGSVLDPETGVSRAAVWSSTDPPEWDRLDIDPANGDVSESLAAIASMHGGETLLAAGRIGEGSDADAALWRNEGDDWQRVTPPEMGGRHEQWAWKMAVGEAGVLVVGGETMWGDIRPRLWFSPDGESWRSVDGGPGGPLDATGEESVQGVTAFGSGFVAVGMRDIDGNEDGVVWASSDGTTWEQVEVPSMSGDGRQSTQSVASVNGVLVAGGYVTDASGHGGPVFWTSTDGRTWSGATPLPLYGDRRSTGNDLGVTSMSATANGQLLAAGGDPWRPHVWVSGDAGASFGTLDNPVDRDSFPDGLSLLDAAADAAGRTLLLGAEPTVLDLQRGARWVDATGDSFPTGGDQPTAASVFLDDDGRMYVGGFTYTQAPEEAPSADGEAPPAAGAESPQRKRLVGRVWVRGGGNIAMLSPEDQPDLAQGRIRDITTYSGGLVAVGIEDHSLADRRSTQPDPNGILWTSPDGESWARGYSDLQDLSAYAGGLSTIEGDNAALAGQAYASIAGQPLVTAAPAGGPGTRHLDAVAPIASGFISVGASYGDPDGDGALDIDPIIAVSPDGATMATEPPPLGGAGTQRFWDVCVADDGSAITVGVNGTDRNFDVAVARRGTDGVWTMAAASDGSFGGTGSQQAFGCATSEDGFMVVGSDDSRGNDDARVWTSADGTTWQQLPSGNLGGTGSQVARAVDAVPGGGWLIAGYDSSAGDRDVALWRVGDDDQVARRDRGEPSLSGPGDQSATSLVVTEDRTIVVGEDRNGVGIWETNALDR